MSPEQAIGGAVDKRSDIFSVGSMLYRMMTNRLPFQAGNDMESLLRVQKGEFEPPEKVRPTVGTSVSAIIMRAMRLAPSERFQTADEMLADVERVLRNEFHSAGQTELKLWLEQLARRDSVPSISKQRFDTGGVIGDVLETDLSVGTSFELDNLDNASAQTDDVLAAAATISAPGAAAPTPPPAAFAGSTGRIRSRTTLAAGGVRDFRPGGVRADGGDRASVSLDLGGATRLFADLQHSAGAHHSARPGAGAPAPHGGATARRAVAKARIFDGGAVRCPAERCRTGRQARRTGGPGEKVAVAPGTDAALPDATAPAAEKAAEPSPGKGDEAAGKPAQAAAGGGDKKQEAEEPDEDALLRDAVPNAETAVIGEDEAETAGHPAAKRVEQDARRLQGGQGGHGGPPSDERARRGNRQDEGARPWAHANQPAFQVREHVNRVREARLPADHPARGGGGDEGSQNRREAQEAGRIQAVVVLSPASMTRPSQLIAAVVVTLGAALALGSAGAAGQAAASRPGAPASSRPSSDLDALRAGALAAIAKARARAAAKGPVIREVSLPFHRAAGRGRRPPARPTSPSPSQRPREVRATGNLGARPGLRRAGGRGQAIPTGRPPGWW